MTDKNEVVLVVGGSGFMGQHIIKHLIQEKHKLGIKEIRSLDLVPYKNVIGYPETEDLITFVGDICEPESVRKAFVGVDCVFHCASLVSLKYPPLFEELERNNVYGTKKVIDLCLENNVPRLIYTSSTAVNFVPYMGHSTFSIVVNQTESKAVTPTYDMHKPSTEFDKGFLIPGFASSQLRAERLVLSATGTTLGNNKGYLQTTALRPPLMYGEGDNHFMPPLLKFLAKRNNKFPRIAGAGGKHQLAYVGNVAWGHICAYKTLKTSPKNIVGLPVFVTDDTPVNDIARFVQRMGRESETMKFDTTWWYIPHFVFFLLAFMIEMLVKFILHPLFGTRLNYSLRAISSFTSSVIMYNRLRASIHMDYDPIYDENRSFKITAAWLDQWAEENLRGRKMNNNNK